MLASHTNLFILAGIQLTVNKLTLLFAFFSNDVDKNTYEGQSISNETFLITQVCNDR